MSEFTAHSNPLFRYSDDRRRGAPLGSESEYPESEYPESEYPESEYPESEYPESEYPESRASGLSTSEYSDNGLHMVYVSDDEVPNYFADFLSTADDFPLPHKSLPKRWASKFATTARKLHRAAKDKIRKWFPRLSTYAVPATLLALAIGCIVTAVVLACIAL
jgi:hypothetical protein